MHAIMQLDSDEFARVGVSYKCLDKGQPRHEYNDLVELGRKHATTMLQNWDCQQI